MAAVKLNYETEGSYEVMVTATDSSAPTNPPTGDPTTATVTINVIDIDEKPAFGAVAPPPVWCGPKPKA